MPCSLAAVLHCALAERRPVRGDDGGMEKWSSGAQMLIAREIVLVTIAIPSASSTSLLLLRLWLSVLARCWFYGFGAVAVAA